MYLRTIWNSLILVTSTEKKPNQHPRDIQKKVLPAQELLWSTRPNHQT